MKIALILLIFFMGFPSAVFSQDDKLQWPREIETKDYLVTVYQPQPESIENNIIEGRMAISVKPGEKEMLFCAAWFRASMDTDLEKRTAVLDRLKITKVHFPNEDDKGKIEKLSRLLETELSAWKMVMSLDRLTASLGDIEGLKRGSSSLKNSPPDIYFRQEPTILITIDGDPVIKDSPDSRLSYVANTPFFIVSMKSGPPFYLKGSSNWYESMDVIKGWKETKNIPDEVAKFAEEYTPEKTEDTKTEEVKGIPGLLVVTKPSELLITDGKPDYQSIEGSALLYVQNSESDIIMDVDTQYHYVLLAGRWFRSKTLKDGEWGFIEPADLPEEFSNIPEQSPMSTVRSSVPGTSEAEDALLEQSIPQTATINRKTATVKVEYDGKPEFKKVNGTGVSYAVNTDKTVLQIKAKYYCVDDGIWFVSDSASGPWIVSDVRPKEVDDLPPSCPVYNTKYVYIYDSTPEVVYVGYYPGYCHSYVYGGVVVYGTGYWYSPWYHHYYYPRPYTWGFGVHWSSRYGWGFSYGYSRGWIGWGFHPYSRPYWGPRGYNHGYRHGYDRGYRHGAKAGYRAGQKGRERPVQFNNVNVYKNRKTGVVESKTFQQGKQALKNKGIEARPSVKKNNLFTDKQGNVYQRNKDGSWDPKSNRSKAASVERKPQKANMQSRDRSTVQRPNVSRQQLDRSHVNRSRGQRNYSRSRAAGAARSRAGGGRR